MIFHSVAEAQKQGFTVDQHVYPWVAYKGPRFAPTETVRVLTEIESQLLKQQKKLIDVYWNKDISKNLSSIVGDMSKAVGAVESLGAAG